jgi:hypothetical protein
LHLFETVESWPAADTQTLVLKGNQKRKTREAQVQMSYGAVRLWPPEDQKDKGVPPLVVWVVRVWEVEPPEGVEALEWVLLTSVPTQSVAQAWQRVQWYRCRWIVEDYHQGLKTGCGVEQRHLQTYESLRRLLGLLAPVAVRLLQVRATARQQPEVPACQVLPTEVVQVLATLLHAPVAHLTAQKAWYTIASYGGYQGRKSDGPPGWKTLWKGWFYIQALVEGVQLASQLSLD